MTHLFVFVELLMRPHYLILSYSVDSMVFFLFYFHFITEKIHRFFVVIFCEDRGKNSTHTLNACWHDEAFLRRPNTTVR